MPDWKAKLIIRDYLRFSARSGGVGYERPDQPILLDTPDPTPSTSVPDPHGEAMSIEQVKAAFEVLNMACEGSAEHMAALLRHEGAGFHEAEMREFMATLDPTGSGTIPVDKAEGLLALQDGAPPSFKRDRSRRVQLAAEETSAGAQDDAEFEEFMKARRKARRLLQSAKLDAVRTVR